MSRCLRNFFWPLNCPSLRSRQFKGSKKSWPPQNVPRNGSKSYCPAKKNYVPKFLKQRDIGNFMSFFVPLFCRQRDKCGILWKTTWLHNVDNIRQKDINIIPKTGYDMYIYADFSSIQWEEYTRENWPMTERKASTRLWYGSWPIFKISKQNRSKQNL
jgi:hypothetical protein